LTIVLQNLSLIFSAGNANVMINVSAKIDGFLENQCYYYFDAVPNLSQNRSFFLQFNTSKIRTLTPADE
jgi:hypothetical protein